MVQNCFHDDMDDINDITLQLSQKEKSMVTNKLEEEYREIKLRMKDIVHEYNHFGNQSAYGYSNNFSSYQRSRTSSSSSCTSSESSLFSDEDELGSSDEDTPESDRNGIFDLLRQYEGVCTDRQTVLTDLFEQLDGFDSSYNFDVDEVDESSNLILSSLNELDMKPKKLLDIHNRLMKMSLKNREEEGGMVKEVKEMMIQKDIIKQFTKLRAAKVKRESAADEGQLAADEIVELLQAVRREGATDVEKLEDEFTKLVEAFTARGILTEEIQSKLDYQQKRMNENKAETNQIQRENTILQEKCDCCKVKLKTANIKYQNMEKQLKLKAQEGEVMERQKRIEQEKSELEAKTKMLKNEILLLQKQYHEYTENNLEKKCSEERSDGDVERVISWTSDSSEASSHSIQADKHCHECDIYQEKLIELKKKSKDNIEEINDLKKKIDMMKDETRLNTNHGISSNLIEPSSETYDSSDSDSEESEEDIQTTNTITVTVDRKQKEIIDMQNTPQSMVKMSEKFTQTKSIAIVEKKQLSMEERVEVEIENDSVIIDSAHMNDPEKEFEEIEETLLTFIQEVEDAVLQEREDEIRPIVETTIEEYSDEEGNENEGKYRMARTERMPSLSACMNTQILTPQSQASRRPSHRPSFMPMEEEDSDSNKRNGGRNRTRRPSIVDSIIKDRNDHDHRQKTSSRKYTSVNIRKLTMPTSMDTIAEGGRRQRNSRVRKTSISFPSNEVEEGVEKAESGFFESNTLNRFVEMNKSIVNKVDLVMSYLNRVGKKKCSYISNMLDLLNDDESADDDVRRYIEIFMKHAIELFKIIMFAIKQLHNSGIEWNTAGFTEQLFTQMKQTWQPTYVSENESEMADVPTKVIGMDSGFKEQSVPNQSSKELITTHPSNTSQKLDNIWEETNMLPLPNLPKRKLSSLQIDLAGNDSRLEKIAEKKRLKILERQRKLVDRLKAGGASTKQIYAILGISTKTKKDLIEDTDTLSIAARPKQSTSYDTDGSQKVIDEPRSFLPPIPAHQQRKQTMPAQQRKQTIVAMQHPQTRMVRRSTALPTLPLNNFGRRANSLKQPALSTKDHRIARNWRKTNLPPIANMSSPLKTQLASFNFIGNGHAKFGYRR